MSALTLGEIARLIDARLDGEAERPVRGMAALESAGSEQLCYAESERSLDLGAARAAAGVIVGEGFPQLPSLNLLRVKDPKVGFVRAMELFRPSQQRAGVHTSAVVADDAEIAGDTWIGPRAVIESGVVIGAGSQIGAGVFVGCGARIGRDCAIGPNVVLMDGSVIGDRCVLHAGAVIGADGYGFHWMADHHHKIPQLGVVVLEDDVEIGANSCVDRATLGETRIGRGSKLDNLVQVGHNCRIGEHVLLVSQVGIAGSSRLGNHVVAGGQVGIADHVTVADAVQIGAQGGVIGDLQAGDKVWGTPARPIGRVLREQAAVARLPVLQRKLREQQKALELLRERIAALEARGGE
jgi:UDP-3-O-[3-hydroxymyristoyl] glucosamine N-acyltransferase